MLSLACRNTSKLIRGKSKSDNVRLGRLFTKKDTARRMADMLNIPKNKSAITVLDPGAGTGILSAAVIEKICREAPACRQIFLTCYETDDDFVPVLEDNLERIRKKCRHDYDVRLFVSVYHENYLTESKNHYTVTFFNTEEDRYDIVICNPPSSLAEKSSDEAECAGGVTQVKLSEAYLFLKTAMRHIEDNGQLVIMLPTAFASAASLTPLRREIASALALTGIHLFVGKQKNASRAVPLKKNIILAYAKSERPDKIVISTSTDAGSPDNTKFLPALDYSFVVDPADGSLTLPKSVEDTKIVKYISSFPETLASLGLRMSTGLIIDSRCDGLLFSEAIRGSVPLLRPACIKGGQVEFPTLTKKQYLAPVNPALIQRNKNLIVIKRIPAKSDERFVNSAIYLAAQLPAYRYISTHNKINFIDTKDPSYEMCARLAYGVFALLNSTIYDRYISIVSKSKQINSKEFRTLPLPPRNIIENMGMRLMSLRQTTVKACDSIVNPTLHIIEK